MQIFDREPTDWRDLQNMVGQLFTELCCTVQVSVTVPLVRGKKEIDVLADDPHTYPPSRYAIECKYWSNPVPQEVVHSFRTVVSDLGAHRGIIVSKVGFQSGSFEVADNTNIDLFTFDELQSVFWDRWRNAIPARFMSYGDALFPYWDPTGGKRPPSHWGKTEQEKLRLLVRAYHPFTQIGPAIGRSGFRIKLPMVLPTVDDLIATSGELTISTYREFSDFLDKNKQIALDRFQNLFAEKSS
jgi:hypothetical protein